MPPDLKSKQCEELQPPDDNVNEKQSTQLYVNDLDFFTNVKPTLYGQTHSVEALLTMV